MARPYPRATTIARQCRLCLQPSRRLQVPTVATGRSPTEVTTATWPLAAAPQQARASSNATAYQTAHRRYLHQQKATAVVAGAHQEPAGWVLGRWRAWLLALPHAAYRWGMTTTTR